MADGKRGVIYLDTSGAMKLVRPETHSDDMSGWLSERQRSLVVSSELIEVELIRATRRSAPDRVDRAAEVLDGIGMVALAQTVKSRASSYPEPDLRSLDAIHLATAEHVVAITEGQLDAFVAYDDRLLMAARDAGLPAVAPGAE